MVPSRYAEVDELLGIGRALGDAGNGAFGMNSDFDDRGDRARLDDASSAKETGRPVWFLLTDRPTDPRALAPADRGVHAARAQGAMVTAQVAGRPVGVLLGIDTALNPFTIRPSYQALLKPAGRRSSWRGCATRDAAPRSSPTRRRRRVARPALAIPPAHRPRAGTACSCMGDPPDYEPPASESIAAIAAREGRTPDEVAYDYMAGGSAAILIFFPVPATTIDNHDVIHTMLTDRGDACSASATAARIAPRSSMPACRAGC